MQARIVIFVAVIAIAIGIALALATRALGGETLPAPLVYAFPSSWVAKEQRWVNKYWPGAACRGRVPVPLAGGGRGFRFIECVDELSNPPMIIWFRINSNGYVIIDYRLKQ